jgi:hypothetical protein
MSHKKKKKERERKIQQKLARDINKLFTEQELLLDPEQSKRCSPLVIIRKSKAL